MSNNKNAIITDYEEYIYEYNCQLIKPGIGATDLKEIIMDDYQSRILITSDQYEHKIIIVCDFDMNCKDKVVEIELTVFNTTNKATNLEENKDDINNKKTFTSKFCYNRQGAYYGYYDGQPFIARVLITIQRQRISITIGTLLANRLFHKESSDIIIISSDNKEFPAHKFILGMRSPVFLAMLTCGMAESINNIIKFNDFDSNTIEQCLTFLYTDDCDFDLLSLSDYGDNIYNFSLMYDIPQLSESLSFYYLDFLSHENVVSVLKIAHKYNQELLKNRAIKYLTTNPEIIQENPMILDLLDDLIVVRELTKATFQSIKVVSPPAPLIPWTKKKSRKGIRRKLSG